MDFVFLLLVFVDFFQRMTLVIPNYQLEQIWFLKKAQYKNLGDICSSEISRIIAVQLEKEKIKKTSELF